MKKAALLALCLPLGGCYLTTSTVVTPGVAVPVYSTPYAYYRPAPVYRPYTYGYPSYGYGYGSSPYYRPYSYGCGGFCGW